MAKLFQNQEDLLAEFGQFLPDANGSAYGGYVSYLCTVDPIFYLSTYFRDLIDFCQIARILNRKHRFFFIVYIIPKNKRF